MTTTPSENKWVLESDEFGGDILYWETSDGDFLVCQVLTNAVPDADPDDDELNEAYDWLVKCVTEHQSYY